MERVHYISEIEIERDSVFVFFFLRLNVSRDPQAAWSLLANHMIYTVQPVVQYFSYVLFISIQLYYAVTQDFHLCDENKRAFTYTEITWMALALAKSLHIENPAV